MKRRTFLKLASVGSLSVAAGCTSHPEKTLYSLVEAPDDMVTGKSGWYATTCRECPAGCGVLADVREGRVVKLEGNPLHPINEGRLCMRGQAALQGVYNPDRLQRPKIKKSGHWQDITYQEAVALLKKKIRSAADSGSGRVRLVTETVGESLFALFSQAMANVGGQPPLIFEPYAYENLKAANRAVFGRAELPSYKLDQSDLIVSFGADFLETWLSPVEYARRFKAMHAASHGRKGIFVHISPFRSLTGVNADTWLSCRPGTETVVALGLLRRVVSEGRRGSFSEADLQSIADIADSYTAHRISELAGINPEAFEKCAENLLAAERPLVLGTGLASGAFSADAAANLLNGLLDPDLSRMDFAHRHRVEIAATRAEIAASFEKMAADPNGVVLLNNVNPVYAMAGGKKLTGLFSDNRLFVVCFSAFMDETTEAADLIIPARLPLESWDIYESKTGLFSSCQPAMGKITEAPHAGDIILAAMFDDSPPAADYKSWLRERLKTGGIAMDEKSRLEMIRKGGLFYEQSSRKVSMRLTPETVRSLESIQPAKKEKAGEVSLLAAPSIRFFDGRGANRPWLCEAPDPLTQVAWQTPVLMHPDTIAAAGLAHEKIAEITTKAETLSLPVYEYEGVRPGVAVVAAGQGHTAFGRWAKEIGANPFAVLDAETDPETGAPSFAIHAAIASTGETKALAHTDGSRIQHGRKIALRTTLAEMEESAHDASGHKAGLTMNDFPLTLPLPEGYDANRDIYPAHDHDTYRWSMIVDLDRCIGCGACSVACYAENNLGVVGEEQMIKGREMSWLRVERYHDPDRMEDIIFLPMMCQHCDNAPCESVCPVYAPHHSKEGLNNQIYNRCIGTRFCAQNCPYKVRRFNWFTWQWPEPLNLQLNPDVTVRSKGVMEKCSFCVQRIKAAHDAAKNENRKIRDGEVVPACVQTCPTGALSFGNLMDDDSRVRRLAADMRAYQVMGYLNTKPAVIYLKKVVRNT